MSNGRSASVKTDRHNKIRRVSICISDLCCHQSNTSAVIAITHSLPTFLHAMIAAIFKALSSFWTSLTPTPCPDVKDSILSIERKAVALTSNSAGVEAPAQTYHEDGTAPYCLPNEQVHSQYVLKLISMPLMCSTAQLAGAHPARNPSQVPLEDDGRQGPPRSGRRQRHSCFGHRLRNRHRDPPDV